MFRVTVNSPTEDEEYAINQRWSRLLGIPTENFTRVCYDKRIRREHAQVYINGIVLLLVMKKLHQAFEKNWIRKEYVIPYLRGLFAAEGSVVLKPSGTLWRFDFSTFDMKFVNFLKTLLDSVGLSGTYVVGGKKFQIYGRKNFLKIKAYRIHILHPEKREKFERGLMNYKRIVEKGENVMRKILKLLLEDGPLGYTEISKRLNKGRSTIQYGYIPKMEKNGLVKRVGKRRAAWLFGITEKGKEWLKHQALP